MWKYILQFTRKRQHQHLSHHFKSPNRIQAETPVQYLKGKLSNIAYISGGWLCRAESVFCPIKCDGWLGVATPAILTDCLHNQSEEIDQFSADPPCDCKTPPSSSHRYSYTLYKSPAPSPDTSRYYLTEINTNLFSSRGSTQSRVLQFWHRCLHNIWRKPC